MAALAAGKMGSTISTFSRGTSHQSVTPPTSTFFDVSAIGPFCDEEREKDEDESQLRYSQEWDQRITN